MAGVRRCAAPTSGDPRRSPPQRGWTYAERGSRAGRPLRGRRRSASGTTGGRPTSLTGRHDGRPIRRRSTTGTHDRHQYGHPGDTARRERTTAFSVVAGRHGCRVRRPLAVDARGTVSSASSGRLTNSDIELESEDFNRAFTVNCPDRKFASDVLHPRMMELPARTTPTSALAVRARQLARGRPRRAMSDARVRSRRRLRAHGRRRRPDPGVRVAGASADGRCTARYVVARGRRRSAVLLVLSAAVAYNRFVRQRTLVDESWGEIDVELTRRHELIPNLVATVRGVRHRTSGRCSRTLAAGAGGAPPPTSDDRAGSRQRAVRGQVARRRGPPRRAGPGPRPTPP